jgi:hypothetical protein
MLMIVLALVLRFSRFRNWTRLLLFGGIGGYVGLATAGFTSIGVAYWLYQLQIWRFPDNGDCPSRGVYLALVVAFVIIPLLGLLAGGSFGIFLARKRQMAGHH